MSDGSGSAIYEGPTGINVISVDHGGFTRLKLQLQQGLQLPGQTKVLILNLLQVMMVCLTASLAVMDLTATSF